MTNLLREAWDRFLLYFPLVSMGLLALATYWLVRNTSAVGGPVEVRPAQHYPDYFMENFSVRTFDAAGRLRSEVVGKSARHYPDTLFLEVDGIRVRSFDAQGRLSTASADHGLTNEDSSELELIGSAVIVREASTTSGGALAPRMEFRSEFLHAFMNSERVQSYKPVEFWRGQDRFAAGSMEFDNVEQMLQLSGRVKATLKPKSNQP